MQNIMKQLCGEQPFHSLSNAHRIFVIFKKIESYVRLTMALRIPDFTRREFLK